MVFCQQADCQSLRDIELGMKGIRRELGHLGIRKAPSRNALSRQNRRRNPWVAREVYRRLREKLLGQQPYRCAFRKGIDASRVKLLDSSTETLCLNIFPWAGYSEEKGAVKLHTLFSFNDFLPVDVFVADGKMSDNEGPTTSCRAGAASWWRTAGATPRASGGIGTAWESPSWCACAETSSSGARSR